VARRLRSMGFDAAALQGGFAAWRAAHPVEPIEVAA
jgi:rhodanese-related sulfurtransferase